MCSGISSEIFRFLAFNKKINKACEDGRKGIQSVKIYNLVFDNDMVLHAESPSGLLTGSPLIRAASSSAKDEGPVS